MWLVFGAVYAVLGTTALILRGMAGEPTFAGPQFPGERRFACVQFVAPNARDDDYCDRLVRDLVRRPELTAEQQSRLAGQAKAVKAAVKELSWCGHPVVPSPYQSRCANIQFAEQVSQAHVDALQMVLFDAGFMGAIVRIAGPDDPAPRGAVIYAVPVGDACVLGHVLSLGGGGNQLVAPLPNGRCLSPA